MYENIKKSVKEFLLPQTQTDIVSSFRHSHPSLECAWI